MARKWTLFTIFYEMSRIELEIRRAENLIEGINANKRINEIRLEKLRKELKDLESPH